MSQLGSQALGKTKKFLPKAQMAKVPFSASLKTVVGKAFTSGAVSKVLLFNPLLGASVNFGLFFGALRFLEPATKFVQSGIEYRYLENAYTKMNKLIKKAEEKNRLPSNNSEGPYTPSRIPNSVEPQPDPTEENLNELLNSMDIEKLNSSPQNTFEQEFLMGLNNYSIHNTTWRQFLVAEAQYKHYLWFSSLKKLSLSTCWG